MRKIIIALSAIALLCSCNKDYYDEGYYDDKYYKSSKEVLILRNFSSDTTVWFVPEKDHATSLPAELSEWQKISICEVQPHSSYSLTFDSNDSYVTPVETYGPSDSLQIYVFKKSVWDSHSWEELVSGKMWSGYCSLSVKDAIDLDGIVTYPMK